MKVEDVASSYNALYPEELIERYNAGERDFARINLLRTELEHILGSRTYNTLIEYVSPSLLKRFNPLWADYRTPGANEFRIFEWDSYGRFIPVEYNDLLPPRDLSGADLSGINLEGSYLYPVDLSNANLTGANLRNAILIDADLKGADLSRADLRRSLLEADLRDANLYMARLERAALCGSDMRGANLKRAKLKKANLSSTDLRGANLSKAHFDQTGLNWVNLQGVNLEDVELHNVFIRGVTIDASQQSNFLTALGIHLIN
jgi:uncharacterized protein YjbI with pentapeptide repeats